MKKTKKELLRAVVTVVRRSAAFTNPLNPDTACKLDVRLEEFVEHDGFLGLTIEFGNDYDLWGCNCSLSVNGDGEPSISWSSTSRTPAMARTALKFYSQACDLADEIQAVLDSTTVTDEKK